MEVGVTPDSVSCEQQAESRFASANVTLREPLSGNASHFMIVMMPTMADLINP
jgi:hypothetical protein